MLAIGKKIKLKEVPIAKVRPNPKQPRKEFDEATLQELAASIKECGVQNPVRVRQLPGDEEAYELIAGERRLRAAEKAGLEKIPALVGAVEDHDLLVLALIENTQRENLKPIEEALGYQALSSECEGDINVIVTRTGKPKQHIEKRIALLTLPISVQGMLNKGEISLGCAELLTELVNTADIVKYAAMTMRFHYSPAQLRARIQHLPSKSKNGPAAGRQRQKITSKTISAVLINAYNLVNEADPVNINNKDRTTLISQIEVLQEELNCFVKKLSSDEDSKEAEAKTATA